MKCSHCGGNIIVEAAHFPYPERWYCFQCGRDIESQSYPKKKGGDEMKKLCPKCKQEKDIGEFGMNSKQPDGRQRVCFLCAREYGRISRERKRQGISDGKKIRPKVGLDNPKSKPDRVKVREPSARTNVSSRDAIPIEIRMIREMKASVVREVIKVLEERFLQIGA